MCFHALKTWLDTLYGDVRGDGPPRELGRKVDGVWGRWGEGNPAVDNVLKPGLLDLIPRVCRGRSVTLSGTHETDHRPLVATAPAWHSPVPLSSGFHRALRELRGRQQDQKALEKTSSLRWVAETRR